LEAYNTLAAVNAVRNPNVALGAICTYAWKFFLANEDTLPVPQVDMGQVYRAVIRQLDDQSFAYHFLFVSSLLHRYIIVTSVDGTASSPRDDIWKEKRRKLIDLELEFLLWPVRLPKQLTVVKDELIATPGAIILHVLHNTLLLVYYCRGIRHKEIYGRMLSIHPVPGLLQFLCGMASSSFKCRPEIIRLWPALKDCLLLTARLVVELYKETEYENCKISLSFFKEAEEDSALYAEIQELLGNDDWASKDEDGAALYWVVRDIRSMSLQNLD
jgi:hypothetical protein